MNAAIVFILTCALVFMTGFDAKPAPSAGAEGFVEKKVEDVTEGIVDGLYAEDLMAILPLLGNLPEDVGISEACVRYSYPGCSFYDITVDGLLFGKRAYGRIESEITNVDAERVMRFARLYSYDLGFSEARNALIERYGAAEEEWDEPYVASNGGAVHVETYRADGGTITVKCASNNNWIQIQFAGE